MRQDRNLYILCGGQSTRMGSDKAQLAFDGSYLLEILIRRANPFFSKIILLSGGNFYQTETEVRQLDDAISEAGPLGGLMSALKDASGSGHSHIAMVPVDLPLFSEKSFQYLSEEEPCADTDAIIAKAGENVQPLAGIYNVRLVLKLDAYLRMDKRRVQGFISEINHTFFLVAERELQNINTPAEYQKILSIRKP